MIQRHLSPKVNSHQVQHLNHICFWYRAITDYSAQVNLWFWILVVELDWETPTHFISSVNLWLSCLLARNLWNPSLRQNKHTSPPKRERWVLQMLTAMTKRIYLLIFFFFQFQNNYGIIFEGVGCSGRGDCLHSFVSSQQKYPASWFW